MTIVVDTGAPQVAWADAGALPPLYSASTAWEVAFTVADAHVAGVTVDVTLVLVRADADAAAEAETPVLPPPVVELAASPPSPAPPQLQHRLGRVFLAALPDGLNILRLRARDPAGNVGPAWLEHRWVVDTSPPVASFTALPLLTPVTVAPPAGDGSSGGDGSGGGSSPDGIPALEAPF